MDNTFINIEDIALESIVKDALNLTDKEDISLKDAEKVRKLDCSNAQIQSLKGVQYLKNLNSLDLSFNNIDDLSYIKNLKLDYLNLKEIGNIKDFSVLSVGELKNHIKKIDLSGNYVESFAFLGLLPKLEVLYLNNMGFDEFSELPSLENLRKLYLEDNELENIENPPYLPSIKEIYLSRNQLTYIDGIEKLKTLEKIRISYNKIETISPLKTFKKLKKLYMSYNQIVDLTPLQNIEITEKFALDGNYIVDVEPIKHLINSKLDIFGLESAGIIRPTSEQRDVINYNFDDVDILKVNAYAGTGKTTTAIQFIENYTIPESRKILYLTFNKSVNEDIKRKIPSNLKTIVEAKTAHGFAWGHLNLGDYNKYRFYSITATNIRDYLYFDVKDKKESLKDARIVEGFIKFYLNSAYSYEPQNIKDAFEKFFTNDDRITVKTEQEIENILIDCVKILVFLLTKHHKKELSYDFYLKLFHLTLRNQILKFNNKYQLVIFDEAQDASHVMFDCIDKMNAKKIFIGDGHQEIYSFRHAINVLNQIDVKPLELTNSFRFGENIADLANKILSLKGVQTKIKGKGNDRILFYDIKNGVMLPKEKFSIISRTNIPLFNYAYEAFKEKKKIYFEGLLKNYPFATPRAKSIYYLYKKEYGKIKDNFIKEFNSIWKLREYSMEVQDKQLYSLVQLIENYGENFYKALLEIKSAVVEEKDNADIILTTAHKSKGVEYDNVVIDFDFKVDPFKINNNYEEVNMLYVAITRAKHLLYLPKEYSGFLEIDIEKTIKSVIEFKTEDTNIKKLSVNIDLYKLNEFERELNRIYNLPMSNNISISSEKLEIARKMINMGFPLDQVSMATGIDINKLKNII